MLLCSASGVVKQRRRNKVEGFRLELDGAEKMGKRKVWINPTAGP